MIEVLFSIVVLIGLFALAVGAMRSLISGRLEPYSSWMEAAGKPPMLRSASPAKFWFSWMAQAWISLVPTILIIAALIRAGWR